MITVTGDMGEWAAQSGFGKLEQQMGPESYANLIKHQEASLRISEANEEQIRAGTKQIEASIKISTVIAGKQERISQAIGAYATLGMPFFVIACAAGCWGVWDWVLG